MFNMTFEEISNKAKSEWEALQKGSYILIGTATCGRAAGALDVVGAFKKELRRQGLEVRSLCYDIQARFSSCRV
jgi:NADH-quinone oxidoreductase subunit F